MSESSASIWGELRALCHRPQPLWTGEVLRLLSKLPREEHAAATAYITTARHLPQRWTTWELSLRSIFELFLDAPLDSFDALHGYPLYIKPDESAWREVYLEEMTPAATRYEGESPSIAAVIDWTEGRRHFGGDSPISHYPLARSGHLLFDWDSRARSACEAASWSGEQSALLPLRDARREVGKLPFFYEKRAERGGYYPWPNVDLLLRVESDGTLFDALYNAFRFDAFEPSAHVPLLLCEEDRVDGKRGIEEEWFDMILDGPWKDHIGERIGLAHGPWEQRAHHADPEVRFGSPPGNAGCTMRIAGHCSPKWPSEVGCHGDSMGSFAEGGFDQLPGYVKGVVSWVYAFHGNSHYGGMCVVEGTEELARTLGIPQKRSRNQSVT